jgi:hypothetical protein
MDLVLNLPPVALGLAALGAVLLGLALWLLGRSRNTPAERERKRRLAVHGQGRVCNASVIDLRDDALHYRYSIAGVEYTASQDISNLRDLLPPDPSVLIGPATLKYLPRNPANSIVLCEEWSGLRSRPPKLSR